VFALQIMSLILFVGTFESIGLGLYQQLQELSQEGLRNFEKGGKHEMKNSRGKLRPCPR
jgi:hypothetical protein